MSSEERDEAPFWKSVRRNVREFLHGILFWGGVGAVLIGFMELSNWGVAFAVDPQLARHRYVLWADGFFFFLWLVLLAYVGQAAIHREYFRWRDRRSQFFASGQFLGSFLVCMLMFASYSRKMYVVEPSMFSGDAANHHGPWFLYSLNSFLEGILLGAPSMFNFEISTITPTTFYSRLTLFMFRVVCVVVLIQTAALLGRLYLAGESPPKDPNPKSREMANDGR